MPGSHEYDKFLPKADRKNRAASWGRCGSSLEHGMIDVLYFKPPFLMVGPTTDFVLGRDWPLDVPRRSEQNRGI